MERARQEAPEVIVITDTETPVAYTVNRNIERSQSNITSRRP
jgi:hypothetical protein